MLPTSDYSLDILGCIVVAYFRHLYLAARRRPFPKEVKFLLLPTASYFQRTYYTPASVSQPPFASRIHFLIDVCSLNSCSTCQRRASITCRARSSQQTSTFFWGRCGQCEFPPLPLPLPFPLPLPPTAFYFIFYTYVNTSYTFWWAAAQHGVWVLSNRKITQPHWHTHKQTCLYNIHTYFRLYVHTRHIWKGGWSVCENNQQSWEHLAAIVMSIINVVMRQQQQQPC